MILSFHTWSSFIHTLSLHFLCVFFLFFLSIASRLLYRSIFFSFCIWSPLFRFPFFLRDAFSILPTLRTLSHSEHLQAGERVVVGVITCTHPGRRRRLRRCVKPGNRFGTRNRAGRLRGTIPRRTCISPLARHGGNNHRTRIGISLHIMAGRLNQDNQSNICPISE